MISSLRGEVVTVSTSYAVIDVGGVGMQFFATPTSLSALRIGSSAFVHTSLVVREDSLTLYGFSDDDERGVFDILHSVSGIGPRTALAVLSVLTPNMLRAAVERKDEAALTRVPGIGKKGAQRMILELGTKLGPAIGETGVVEPQPAERSEVLEALINLGWQEREAASALEEARTNQPEGTVAQLLRSSLQILGQRR